MLAIGFLTAACSDEIYVWLNCCFLKKHFLPKNFVKWSCECHFETSLTRSHSKYIHSFRVCCRNHSAGTLGSLYSNRETTFFFITRCHGRQWMTPWLLSDRPVYFTRPDFHTLRVIPVEWVTPLASGMLQSGSGSHPNPTGPTTEKLPDFYLSSSSIIPTSFSLVYHFCIP